LFPSHLKDYIAEDNLVMVVDTLVDLLDSRALGFFVASGSGNATQAVKTANAMPGRIAFYMANFLVRVRSSE
jgi:hypothetical protein